MIEKNLIFADFGNSNVKFLSPDGKFLRFAYNDNSLYRFFDKKEYKIVFSSVNPKAVENIINQKNTEAVDAFDILTESDLIDFSEIEGIGADRIFGLLGALSQSYPPLITIDCGTAVTINVLNDERKVLGGVIMPGHKLQEFALQNRTEGLKRIIVSKPEELIGQNTNAAISSGIYHGIAAAVVSIVSGILTDILKQKKVNIFLTGGGSLLILPYLQKSFKIIHDEMLVLKGIKYTYEKWLREKN